MAKEIIYIDENGNKCEKSIFLDSFKERGIDTEKILQLINKFDYCGGFHLSEKEYLKTLQKLPREARIFLENATNTNEGVCYLRGDEYYLNIIFEDDIEMVRHKLIENTKKLQNLMPALEFRSNISLEEKILHSSLLDHKKHYSLAFLIGLYNHMLTDPDFDIETYKRFRDVCERDIDNYYRFLLAEKSPEIIDLNDEELNHSIYINPPKDTLEESGARRLIFREMDHPGQLILYSGNLFKKDGEKKVDVVVNPLAGAIEIGCGLKSIFNSLGIEKIDNIYFIWYSSKAKGHYKPITTQSLKEYVPKKLIEEFENMKNKRIFLIDDNAFSGKSIRNIKDFLIQNYSSDVNLAVIEMAIIAARKRKEKGFPFLDLNELAVPVISNWRYINRVEEEVKRYNFGGKYGS